jgi:hypothetical protein
LKANHLAIEHAPGESTPIRSSEPWRVGVVIDGYSQPRWIVHALSLLEESSVAGIALVVVVSPRNQGGPGNGSGAIGLKLSRLFVKADRKLFRRSPDPLESVAIASLAGGAESIEVPDPVRIDEATHARIREAALNVIVSFGSVEVARQITSDARLGVWYFPDLQGDSAIDWPIGFHSTTAGEAVAETSLCDLAPDGGRGATRYATVSAVNRLSPHYTERRLLWKMATYPLRAISLANEDSSAPDDRSGSSMTPSSTANTAPGIVSLAGTVARFGGRLAGHAGRSAFFQTEWTLGYRRNELLSLETISRDNPPGTYALIENPPDRFWADPFPVTDGENRWLFVEEFPHSADRAHLSVMAIAQDGSLGPPTKVLSLPYHLSYPFVFPWKGEWYMVPETLDNKTVDLYRSTRFPYDWTHERCLLDDVSAVDATLAEIEGRWWMFTSIAPFGGSENDELHIFHADSPLGPWSPHQGNPQVSDVRRARPAGRMFNLDGAWYRPAQDCSRRYGYAMSINRVTELSTTGYAEECVARIEPTWAGGLLGTHTFNHDSGTIWVDGDLSRPRRLFRR